MLPEGHSQFTGIPVSELLKTFGRYLLKQFVANFPHFFEGISSVFDFLERVDAYIHVEVRKLYLDAELPKFKCQRLSLNQFVMTYYSDRHLGDLAEGLIQGSIAHF